MKKILLLIAAVVMTTAAASAVRYKGYGELTGGAFIPSSDYYGMGGLAGISTSHGVEIIQGLFVGGGIDANLVTYTEPSGGRYSYEETDYTGNFAVFAEARYNFLRTRKVSPFIGTRIGGGYEGLQEMGCFYFSPAVGVTINLTKKFGLDASVGYSLWSGPSDEDDHDSKYFCNTVNGIALRFGVHF